MQFELTDDQRDLQQMLRAFTGHHATSADVRTAAEHGAGFAPAIWKRLTDELELTGVAVEPDHGGTGATFVEVGIALEELGRTLAPVPFLPTVVAAHVIGDAAPGQVGGPLLERITAGARATIALADNEVTATLGEDGISLDGEVHQVLDGPHADLLVLTVEAESEPTLFGVDLAGSGVEVDALPTMDQTRRQATVRLTGADAVRLTSQGSGTRAVERARDVLSVAYASESVGAASRCFEVTIAYLGERVQFGRPIGSFQALKHRCADMLVALESARSTAQYASWVVDGAPEELPIVAPLAQLVCSEAFLQIAGESIQMHGGIGFTWEHDAHMYFKRAKATELLGGGHRQLRRTVGDRAGII
jgi:alkylation response protein AidB-like acyl-CoA dehydrogenase